MFSNLKKYGKQSFEETAPSVYIITEEGTARYDIFAAFEMSVIDCGIVPDADSRIVTLVTCTGSGHEKRMVVQAVRS